MHIHVWSTSVHTRAIRNYAFVCSQGLHSVELPHSSSIALLPLQQNDYIFYNILQQLTSLINPVTTYLSKYLEAQTNVR
jgi:hypothetical protein